MLQRMDTNAKANIYLQIHECKLGDKKSTHIERIKHDIRNCKRLSAEQTTAMLCLTEVEKNELLLIFNDVVAQVQELLNSI